MALYKSITGNSGTEDYRARSDSNHPRTQLCCTITAGDPVRTFTTICGHQSTLTVVNSVTRQMDVDIQQIP